MNNRKTSGGKMMSLTRRLGLLAGSSLIAGGLSAVISAGAVMAPTLAAAQTASCAPAPTSGNGTGTVVYGAGTYNPGILCNYSGDGAVVSTSGAITVGTSGGVPGDPLVNGINLRGAGGSDILWDSRAGTVTGGAATNGALIDAQTETGNINLLLGRVVGGTSAASSTTTHGVLARSNNGGDVSVTASGLIDTNNCCSSNAISQAGLEARSVGGNGDVSVTVTDGQISGRLYAIRAEASGTGELTINMAGGNAVTENINNGDPTSASIFAKTGTGMLRIDAGGQLGNIGSRNSSAVRIETMGDAVLNLSRLFVPGTGNAAVDMTTSAGTLTQVNLGTFDVNTASKLFRGSGGGAFDINVTGLVWGSADFAAASGIVDMNLASGARWWHNGSSFGSANDLLIVETGASVFGSGTLAFGTGDDIYSNAGVLIVGADDNFQMNSSIASRSGSYRITGLERFDNAGTIYMGGFARLQDLGSDSYPDDLLHIVGGTFTGLDGSLILMDVNLNGDQRACDAALRSPVSDDLPGGDCLRIENGATAGVTRLRVKEQVAGDRGRYGSHIVVIDTAGSVSAAGHFILDEGSAGYNPGNGGFIDKGFFIYPLVYDAGTEQHKLVATLGQDALQFPLVAQAAHQLWRLSTGTWLDRQADMRGGLDEGFGGGVWMRVATEFADSDVSQTVDVVGNPFTFDNTNTVNSYAVTGGVDVVSGGAGDSAWVLGLTAGYAHADMAFDTSPNAMRLDGWTGGGYASFVSGGLYVDATMTANRLELEGDVPALNLKPLGTLVATNLISVGGQVEAGWRLPLTSNAFVEPLAGFSYVRTKYDDLNIAADDPLRQGVTLAFDDPASLRAGVGARFGLGQDYGGVRAQYSLTGRVWNEFEDEARMVAYNAGDDAVLLNELTGSSGELGIGASVHALDGALSGFVNVGGKFGDDYQATTASAGVRVAW